MFNLIYISTFVFLGSYADLASCNNAIREIYSVKMNPPGVRMPELEESINLTLKTQKVLACVPVKKN